MPYLIVTLDKPQSQAIREEHRIAHYDYLTRHKNLLLASGGLQDESGERFIGGMFVLDVASRQQAEQFLDEDPFTKAGLFESVRIERWKAAFLNYERV